MESSFPPTAGDPGAHSVPADVRRSALTVIDHRAGRRVELPISEAGVIRAAELSGSGGLDGERPLLVYDPGFTNTAACRSAITYIDGRAGVLQHRGYSIEALCEHSTFLGLLAVWG